MPQINDSVYHDVAKQIWRHGTPLSKKELAAFAELVDKASKDILISVAPQSMKAYLLAYRISELIKKAGSINKIKELLKEVKKPPVLDKWTQTKVLNAISKIIQKPTEQLVDKLAMEHLQNYQFNEITWQMDGMVGKIRKAMMNTLMNRESPIKLARRLHQIFDTYEIDMRRVAITETTRARNMAILNELKQSDPRGGESFVYFLVAKDACKHCKRLYLHPDGTPRIFKVSDIEGKSNAGLPVSEWEAAMIIHPNDRCLPVAYKPELEEWKKKWRARYEGKAITPGELKKAFELAKNDPIKKVVKINGIQVAIEHPKGTVREYQDSEHKTPMKCDYGYIAFTNTTNDDMDLDCYVGDSVDSKRVFKLRQMRDGKFDENKYMLGFSTPEEAKEMYLLHMPADWYGGIEEIGWTDFEHLIATHLRPVEPDKIADPTESFDPEQLRMGIEIEMEHTDNPLTAEKIAKDHLREIADYYTRLKKMEAEAKAEMKPREQVEGLTKVGTGLLPPKKRAIKAHGLHLDDINNHQETGTQGEQLGERK